MNTITADQLSGGACLAVEGGSLSRAPGNSSVATPKATAVAIAEFDRLNKVVVNAVSAFIEAGSALREIRDKELWKAGGFPTWDAYCRGVAGMSKVHANRMIQASQIGKSLVEVEPIGSTSQMPAPRSESQVRPLIRLQDPSQQREVWKVAVNRAGGQPTAKQVIDALSEIVSVEHAPPALKDSVSARRQFLLAWMRRTVRERKDWDQMERLVKELEELV